ncbi:uncharacterized protein CXorf65 homolog isoform X2 [Pecten maximus]|uniref:uncharacterized protein CXorf65 homolog isoform X1 n=1 Tax=Pecten maximus TaxID=6579 RepID=UPI001457E60E|nr:uncharacterized protein CXorf65 homolog isoform X1 [Pecten maximus]XP_033740040.1 uncharacterized protein CXorf65 homolog isoform X2 [Pecten maximus]
MFINVEHGDGKTLLVNPDCNAVILQDYVRRSCGIKSTVTIDFSDENAVLTELFSKPPQENMFDFFMPRSTFVLVQIDRGADGSILKVTPLLTDWEKKYPFLERKLRQRDKKAKQNLAAEKDVKEKGRPGSKMSVKSDSPTSTPSKVNVKNGKNSAKGDNRTLSIAPDETAPPKKTSSKGRKKHAH